MSSEDEQEIRLQYAKMQKSKEYQQAYKEARKAGENAQEAMLTAMNAIPQDDYANYLNASIRFYTDGKFFFPPNDKPVINSKILRSALGQRPIQDERAVILEFSLRRNITLNWKSAGGIFKLAQW